MNEKIVLRPEVQRYAEEIEKRLQSHDDDWGDSWKSMTASEALADLDIMVAKLKRARLGGPTDIRRTAASVGAHAMFVAVILDSL